MVRRVAAATVAANAYVFPGGVVRADDYSPMMVGSDRFSASQVYAALSDRGGKPPESPEEAAAIFRAATRELFEEAGVLLAEDERGDVLRITTATMSRFARYREALQAGTLSLTDVLGQERLHLGWKQLRYFSHWITPLGLARRYSTRFFVAQLPAEQEALHCSVETSASRWIQPADALVLADAELFLIVFPTRCHLQRLSTFQSIEDLLTYASQKQIRTVQPIRAADDSAETITLPTEVQDCW